MSGNKPDKKNVRAESDKGKGASFTVGGNDTLLTFLRGRYPDTGRNTVKSMLRDRCVYVNSVPVTQFDHPLVRGDVVEVRKDRRARPVKIRGDRRIRIVYEDNAVIVVDKAEGLLSVADEKGTSETALALVQAHVKEADPGAGAYVVHRLDRDTSGLLLFARSDAIRRKLQDDWNSTVTERSYTAVVEGVMDREEGVFRSFLVENSALRMYSTKDSTKGREAVTRFRTLKRGRDYSLLELKLETGRKNQIRVQLSDERHPVAGDAKYGAKTDPLRRLALHASGLTFRHPETGEILSFRSSTPGAFLRLCRGKDGGAGGRTGERDDAGGIRSRSRSVVDGKQPPRNVRPTDRGRAPKEHPRARNKPGEGRNGTSPGR